MPRQPINFVQEMRELALRVRWPGVLTLKGFPVKVAEEMAVTDFLARPADKKALADFMARLKEEKALADFVARFIGEKLVADSMARHAEGKAVADFPVRLADEKALADFKARPKEEEAVANFVAGLAKEFHFPEDFPLRAKLDRAVAMHLDCTRRRFPKADEVRGRLDSLEEAAKAKDRLRVLRMLAATGAVRLDADLRAAPAEEQYDQRERLGRLLVASGEDDGAAPPDELLFADVLVQVQRARPALLKRRSSTPRRDDQIRRLVFELGLIWTEGTGRPARITNNPYSDGAREGPFLDFLEAVVRGAGIQPVPENGARRRARFSRMALARLAERWLSAKALARHAERWGEIP